MRIQNQNMRTNNLIHLINKWHFFLMSGDYYRLNGLKRQINQMWYVNLLLFEQSNWYMYLEKIVY